MAIVVCVELIPRQPFLDGSRAARFVALSTRSTDALSFSTLSQLSFDPLHACWCCKGVAIKGLGLGRRSRGDMEQGQGRKYTSGRRRLRGSLRSTFKDSRVVPPKVPRLAKSSKLPAKVGQVTGKGMCGNTSKQRIAMHNVELTVTRKACIPSILARHLASFLPPTILPSLPAGASVVQLNEQAVTIPLVGGSQFETELTYGKAEHATELSPRRVETQRMPSSKGAKFLVNKALAVLVELWKNENIPPVFSSLTTVSTLNDGTYSEKPSVRIVSVGSLVPLEAFVEDILAQSRTTGTVLQIALNYIEVLRPQLSQLTGSSREDLIFPPQILDKQTLMKVLPSPLLCPRRVFLAAIILATKFVEDVCAPNREWARVAGLPAWEVGRCERALGDALDWRLWVLTPDDIANRLGSVESSA